MFIPSPLSTYILSVTVAALLVTGVSERPLGLASSSRHSSQAMAEPAFSNVAATTSVDRSRKGDRLRVMRADPAINTTIILRTVVAPEHSVRGVNEMPARPTTLEIDEGERTPKPEPAPLVDCEALASPVSDPILSRYTGRCFV